MQGDDVAEEGRANGDAPRPDVGGLGQVAPRDELLHGELDLALQLDGAGHVDHGARLGLDRGTLLEGQGEDGVGVAVADAVGAAGEGAIVGGRDGRLLGRVLELLLLLLGREAGMRLLGMLLGVLLGLLLESWMLLLWLARWR